ncbi:MAG: insulinase family protein [Deltaproteobacteria bacterium]|nr:insulinase family protein [Deltaproteobacteria bacterium]
MNRLSIFVALLAVLFSGAKTFGKNEAIKLERKVVEFKLSNGMKWLLVRRGEQPVFAGIIQVKVGGIEEEEGKTGLAHMLEHMAFKGTKEIKSNELWDAFVTNGASNLNAYTSKDVTAYHAKMPASKLELWLYLNSEMIRHSVMREFNEERNVVIEELVSKVENDPQRKIDRKLMETAFTKSPYKWQTIGSKDEVAALQPKDLEEFKKKYYAPNRMVGAIAGDIDVEYTKTLIQKYFGAIAGPKNVIQNFPAEPQQKAERRAAVESKSSPLMMIAYHKPTFPNNDDNVFDLITYMLCSGDNSRLVRKLVYDKKVARTVGCSSADPGSRLDNLFVIAAEPMKGHSYEEVEKLIEAELDDFKTSSVLPDELKKTINNVTKELLFGLSDNEGIAHSLAYYETVVSDWRYVTRHPAVLAKIKADEIMNVAMKYFVKENKTVVEIKK